MELHARSGRAVLVRRDNPEGREFHPDTLAIPRRLARALDEWAQVADTVRRAGRQATTGMAGHLVSRRGRQLASELAVTLGRTVGYADPVGGEVHLVRAGQPESAPAGQGGAEQAQPGLRTSHRAEETEPTPWATGLTVTAFVACIVLFGVVGLSANFAETSPWFALLGNVVIAGGLAPSLWLTRNLPVWRWLAHGVVLGLGLAWFGLLVNLLL